MTTRAHHITPALVRDAYAATGLIPTRDYWVAFRTSVDAQGRRTCAHPLVALVVGKCGPEAIVSIRCRNDLWLRANYMGLDEDYVNGFVAGLAGYPGEDLGSEDRRAGWQDGAAVLGEVFGSDGGPTQCT